MKVIKITDTREKQQVDDGRGDTKLVPIPGTGEKRPCDLCGRLHEVHVEIDTGDKILVVGVGCAKKNAEMEVALLMHEIHEIFDASGLATFKMALADNFIEIVCTERYPARWNGAIVGFFAWNWEKMTKSQKLALNAIENRAYKIKALKSA